MNTYVKILTYLTKIMIYANLVNDTFMLIFFGGNLGCGAFLLYCVLKETIMTKGKVRNEKKRFGELVPEEIYGRDSKIDFPHGNDDVFAAEKAAGKAWDLIINPEGIKKESNDQPSE